jgi:hypothetical protein
MHRRSLLGASAAAVACLAFAGVAQADPTSFSGSVPNGGCDGTHAVTVNGPSRIDVQVASTTASPTSVYTEIISPNGSVQRTGSYDTPSGGTYLVRVCKWNVNFDPPTIRFTARYATGPAGQPALPQAPSTGGVLGTTTTLSRNVNGTGAIRTHFGLAYFSVKVGSTGLATVKVYDPKVNRHFLWMGANVRYGSNSVVITKNGMRLTLVDRTSAQRVAFHSSRFRASGKVVKGSFLVV